MNDEQCMHGPQSVQLHVIHTFLVKLDSEIVPDKAREDILCCRALLTELMKADFQAPAGP